MSDIDQKTMLQCGRKPTAPQLRMLELIAQGEVVMSKGTPMSDTRFLIHDRRATPGEAKVLWNMLDREMLRTDRVESGFPAVRSRLVSIDEIGRANG